MRVEDVSTMMALRKGEDEDFLVDNENLRGILKRLSLFGTAFPVRDRVKDCGKNGGWQLVIDANDGRSLSKEMSSAFTGCRVRRGGMRCTLEKTKSFCLSASQERWQAYPASESANGQMCYHIAIVLGLYMYSSSIQLGEVTCTTVCRFPGYK